MHDRRASKAITVAAAAAVCVLGALTVVTLAFTQAAHAGTGPGASGNTITNAAQAQTPFSPGTFDSGQPIDVVIPANSVLTPGASIFILECSAPGGVDPTTINSCDGNTGYEGGTITVGSASDPGGAGSIDVINQSSPLGDPYIVYALPDFPTLQETGTPIHCGLGSANECVLYIGQGGGGDTGLSAPHFFSQAFQIHTDPTDSGTLNPGDGTFPADAAPAITSANHATFVQGTAGSFTAAATGYPPPTFSETGTLPAGVTLSSSGILSGTPSGFGTFPITLQASNGVGTPASQSFTLTVEPGVSGDTIPGAAAAQTPFTPGTFDSGQPIDVVVPPNTILTPGARLEVLECAAPHGVDPVNISACDGNTAYAGGTITVNGDGSVDIMNGSTPLGNPYLVYALPDVPTFSESPSGSPKCGQGSPFECVLYIGQGGGQDTGLSLPHVFSQPFQVHPDPTDSGTLNPGDGTFPADAAPAITSANHTTFVQGTAGTFSVAATGYGPPAITETGALPSGITLSTAGVLAGTTSSFGTYPITITANNGVGTPATQSFTLTVEPGISGDTIPGAAAAQTPFTAGTFDSGQPIDVVVPPNTILTPGAKVEVLECAAPHGVDPVNISACDGNTAYAGGTITVNGDGSIDVMNGSTPLGDPYILYALPDVVTFSESPTGSPRCGQGTPNECVLYIGQGGGQDTGLSLPHVFSQPFQVHPDPTDSGTLNPGNGVSSQADAAAAITSANNTTFTQGTPGSFSVTATGYGPPLITETGTLPSGVHLSTAGLLSGTPSVGGVFPITITANNGVGTPATQAFTLTVDAAPVITSANNATFTEGTPGSFTVTATGTPAPTFSETGTLPGGVTLSAAGVLSGTPTQQGTFPISIQASNGVGTPPSQSFTLTVDATPVITSANNDTFTEGTAGTFTVTATGTPAPTFSETGTLPGGVTLSAAGVLSGTPTQDGSYPISIQATNGVGTPAGQSFTLTVDSVPVITSGNSATFHQGTLGSFTVTATGTPAPTFSETGSLPGGVTLTAAGVLSGTPIAAGTFPITIHASNGVGTPASQSFTLTVTSSGTPPMITSANNATFTKGASNTFDVTATGSPAPTFSETGALPAGVTLSAAGVLSGTPTGTGVFPITIQASNGVGSPAMQSFTLNVVTIRITTTSLPTATRGVPYSATLTSSGGVLPVKWKKLSALPKGLKLIASTGQITGTVNAKRVGPGPFSITVEVLDHAKPVKNTATATLTINIA